MCDALARMAPVRACDALHEAQSSISKRGGLVEPWREREAVRFRQSMPTCGCQKQARWKKDRNTPSTICVSFPGGVLT
jgi:hypothetical protein